MGEIAGKRRKRYVDRPSGESITCLIHGPKHSSGEFKVLGDFGANYVKGNPNKYHIDNPIQRNKFNRQQDNNDIVHNSVDEILLHEN